jgi:hypothetical protein
VIVIPADSAQPARLETVVPELVNFQRLVGGYIERIGLAKVLTDRGMKRVDCDVWLNEEGKIHGLPLNARATDLCAVTIGGWFNDIVVGDVFVCGADGERSVSVPPNVHTIIEEWGWLR